MLQIKSKFKIAKRLGAAVFEKTQSQKFTLSEARTRKVKTGRGRSLSDYGKQMLEKQKVRYTYGLTEHQFRRYVDEAMRVIDSPRAIHEALESRLDNVVYKVGLTGTRRAARQMVSHGHITVQGRRMKTPSYRVRVGDVFAVREGSKPSVLFVVAEKEEEKSVPSWINYDTSTLSGKILDLPTYSPLESGLNYQTVFEFYSR